MVFAFSNFISFSEVPLGNFPYIFSFLELKKGKSFKLFGNFGMENSFNLKVADVEFDSLKPCIL